MAISSVLGWIALLLVPLTACAGWALRRAGKGAFITRMRPHFFLGYGALVLATLHLFMSSGGMGGSNGTGIWLAAFALFALALQAFIGTNLQSPGAYRPTLRRWHTIVFWSVLILALGHIVLNASMLSAMAQ